MRRSKHCGTVLLQVAMMAALACAALASTGSAGLNDGEANQSDITNLSIEELMNLTVTSASKKQESLAEAPAAIYVITSDDIRRSGLSSLPEVLRLAPGLTVQHVNSHAWTVSTRGFNGFPNEKMLVLIDGRAVYDALYGGVYWDVQNVRLADIDRIEVIRGPGGALWGVNAVNGVINIITKPANQTQGLSMDTSLGEDEGYQGSFRFGSQMGKAFSYRIYGQSSFWDPAVDPTGTEMFNDWQISDGGVRADWDVNSKDSLSMDIAGYQGHIRDATWLANYGNFNLNDVAYGVAGGHVLAHWRRTLSGKSQINTLAYCDWTNRVNSQISEEYRVTCDIELQHDYSFSRRHSLTWGTAFRSTADQTAVTSSEHFTPSDQRLNFFSGFGQYDLKLVPDRLRITIGSKFEHSTYGGFDAQPQIRAVWNPVGHHHIWGAVSRSARIPTRNEHDNYLSFFTPLQPPNPPTLIVYLGNPKLHSEHQTAYELGYRYEYRQNWSFDVATFYNSYTGLIYPDFTNTNASFNAFPPYLQIASTFINGYSAQTHGLEVSSKWKATAWWQLGLNATEDRGSGFSMIATPQHQFSIHSLLDLPKRFDFDSAVYRSSPFTDPAAPVVVAVPAGNRVDAGLSWHGVRGLSVGLWGRNLQSDHHIEGNGVSGSTGLVRRSVVAKISWDFNPEKKP